MINTVLAAVLVLPAPVPAAVPPSTIHLEGTDLIFTAADGIVNDITVGISGTRWYVQDRYHPIQPGDGCEAAVPDSTKVTCDLSRFSRVVVRLGDGADLFAPIGDSSGRPYVVRGGAGDDTIRLGPVGGDANGDGGADTIIGSPGDDLIRGGDGNDVIRSLAGSDTIVAGPGAHWIDAGDGDDSVGGGDGADVIAGGPGRDRLHGSIGADTISGGDGDDKIHSAPNEPTGDDLLSGDAGVDSIIGGSGAERLLGGPGDDYLYGGDGDDNLDGNEGADWLVGGAGRDACTRDAADAGRPNPESCELG